MRERWPILQLIILLLLSFHTYKGRSSSSCERVGDVIEPCTPCEEHEAVRRRRISFFSRIYRRISFFSRIYRRISFFLRIYRRISFFHVYVVVFRFFYIDAKHTNDADDRLL